jgi:Large polyvalent protein-associated domain 7
MPRPKRAQGVTSEIHIRVTSDEKGILHIQAQKAGLTVSEYLRRCSLNKRVHSRVSDKAIARLWTINRTTGDVSYTLNGKLSVIDRGRRVTVLNQNEAAIVFGLEMAVQKYGSRIACSRSDDWKRQVVKVAVQNGILVEFTDPEMRDAMYQHQLLANPLQIKAARLHALETRLQSTETN